MKTIIISILFVMAVIFFIITMPNKYEKNHLISLSLYPELKHVFSSSNIIKSELYNAINTDLWTKWIEYDNINETPIFTKMSYQEILNHMNKHNSRINDGKPSWRIFGLILGRKIIKKNQHICPNTIKLLSEIPYVINAGFSCLEPGVSTSLHKGHNDDIYRCHIPLIIPEGNCAIKVDNDVIKWDNNKYFIFDDTYYHQAWNYTNQNRFILIIDIKKY